MYSNGNYVREIAVYDGILWAATGGGIVAWELASGESAKLTTLDGLPTNDIQAVVACPVPEPRIIFGSDAGLTLFDPEDVTLEHMTSDNSWMARNDVDTLDCDPENSTLMIGYTFYLDIWTANTDEWQFLEEKDGLATNFVNQAAVIGDETWVVAPFGVSVIAADGSITAYDEDISDIPDENTEAVAADAAGNIWLAAFDGLIKYDGGAWTLYNSDTVDEFPYMDAFMGVAVASDGTVWAGNTFGTLCQFDPAAEKCLAIYEDEPGMARNLNNLIIDQQGNIYYCDDEAGISMFDGNEWRAFLLDERPASNSYRAIATSPDGTIWVGGYFGLQQFDTYDADGEWETIDLEHNSVNTFYPMPEGMWIGHSAGASFYEYESGAWTHFKKGEAGEGIHKGGATAITVDGAGRVWFGTSSGLTVWDGETYTYHTLLSEEEIREERSPRYIYTLLYDGSNVWVGASGAFFRFDENDEMTRWDDELEGLLATFFAPSAHASALDPEGNVLLAIDRKLLRYDGERFTELVEANSSVQSILVTDEGEIWLGLSDDGVYYYDGGDWSSTTAADGLPSDHFAGQNILIDSLGTIWFAGEKGGLARYVP